MGLAAEAAACLNNDMHCLTGSRTWAATWKTRCMSRSAARTGLPVLSRECSHVTRASGSQSFVSMSGPGHWPESRNGFCYWLLGKTRPPLAHCRRAHNSTPPPTHARCMEPGSLCVHSTKTKNKGPRACSPELLRSCLSSARPARSMRLPPEFRDSSSSMGPKGAFGSTACGIRAGHQPRAAFGAFCQFAEGPLCTVH